jgi:hypothetical protein
MNMQLKIPMVHVECPWCDGPVALDGALEAFECRDCGVDVPFAAEAVRVDALAA